MELIYAIVMLLCSFIRDNAKEVIESLKEKGINRIVMLTGDNEKTAAHVAKTIGADEYISGALPEDKARFIADAKRHGHKVIMIGDGINDSPALSEADVGIAVVSGASIAKEISDITIEGEGIDELLILKDISDSLMKRIEKDYKVIIGLNSTLIILGVLGLLSPSTTALMHNVSTIGIGLGNTKMKFEVPK